VALKTDIQRETGPEARNRPRISPIAYGSISPYIGRNPLNWFVWLFRLRGRESRRYPFT